MKTTQGCCQQNIENQVSWFAVFFFSFIGIVAVMAQLDSRLRFETQVSESSKSGTKISRHLATLDSGLEGQDQLAKFPVASPQDEANSTNMSLARSGQDNEISSEENAGESRSLQGMSCGQTGTKPLPLVSQRCEMSASF
jgi:hypothetical protein